MADLLLIHRHETQDTLVLTSLIKRLSRTHRVTCMADGPAMTCLQYSSCRVMPLTVPNQRYDIAINTSPSITCTELIEEVDAGTKLGYGTIGNRLRFFNEGADQHYRGRIIGIPTDANLFQLVYGIARETWRGEGYSIQYFPKNRSKKNVTGYAIKNKLLSHFVTKNLKECKTRLWEVEFKQNILKQLDEVNRCKCIITDDEAILHVSLALRKTVEYIIKRPSPYKIEMFGSGTVHIFDHSKLRAR